MESRPIIEKPSQLYIVCIWGFVAINILSLGMSALSGLGYHVNDPEKWWDITKISFGFVAGYLFGENKDTRKN